MVNSASQNEALIALLEAHKAGYIAEQNPDGTWNILDVPFMSELPAGAKNNEGPIDNAWHRDAVRRAAFRFMEQGYRAPLHIKHHGFAETRRAGYIMPKSVAPFLYEGRPMSTVFGDLQQIPQDIFELILKEELPYRSIEAVRWENREISTLALLDDDPPFFKYPPLRIRQAVPNPDVEFGVPRDPLEITREPALSLQESGEGGPFGLCFEGEKKMIKKLQEGSAQVEPDPNAAPAAPTDPMAMMLALVEKMMGKIEEMSSKIGSAKAQDDMGGDPEDKDKKDAPEGAAQATPVPAAPVDQPPTSAPVEIPGGKPSEALTEMRTKVLALEEANRKRSEQEKADASRKAQMSKADAKIVELETQRVYLSDDMKKHLRECAILGDAHLESAAKVCASMPQDPPSDPNAIVGGPGNPYPAEVLEYQGKSPEEFEAAKHFLSEWKSLEESGHARGTLKEYLEVNVAHQVGGMEAALADL